MTERLGSRFDPAELAGEDLEEAERLTLAGLARELEGLASAAPVPTTGFTDRVMAAVVAEPDPVPLAAAGRAVRHGRPAALAAAIGDAWRVVVGPRRPLALRAQAAALVIVTVLGGASLTGVALAGAASILTPPPTPVPVSPLLTPSPEASESPEESASPTPSDEASSSPSEEPSETPEVSGSPEPSRTPQPTHKAQTPEPTHESSTPGPTATPEETQTPETTQSPEGTQTPEPTSSGDSGGG